ncbi:DUF445 domain-containing protein [Paludibacterium yongneupense]|uniref:DUF445 domain-containing protein n=1 Tax=Paludibacterium yongneupense TaxID=400061 RepID=UPI00041293B7|nr:DUF445 family protein [Paludibacterium yongneupense]
MTGVQHGTPAQAGTGDERAAELRRSRRLAGGLLVLVSLGFALAQSFGARGAWAWVGAFSEAAMVGALADWFAVSALFRRPFGLPIPHTAIIPRNKNRVADSLARFIRDKFLDTDALLAKMKRFDPADVLAQWLRQPANAVRTADRIASLLGGALRFVDDKEIRRLLQRAAYTRLQALDVGAGIGHLLTLVLRGNGHQRVCDEAARTLAGWVEKEEPRDWLAGLLVNYVTREYPKAMAGLSLMGVHADEYGTKLARGLLESAADWLRDFAADAHHPRRKAIDTAAQAWLLRLQHDPAYRAQVDETKRTLLDDPNVTRALLRLWDDIKDWLEADLDRRHSRTRRLLAQGAATLGEALVADDALREALNTHLQVAARALAEDLRSGVADHIAGTVKAWDDALLVHELEQSVGRDLQFIRVNGTLVGGAIGVLLYGLTRLLA